MTDLKERAVDMALAMVEATSNAPRRAGLVGRGAVRPAAGSSWGTQSMRGQRIARRSRLATARRAKTTRSRTSSSGKRGWSDAARASALASRRGQSSSGGRGGWKPKPVGNLPNGNRLRKKHFGGSPSATKAYQRRYGLQVDGVVGRQTMSAVKKYGTRYGARPPRAYG
jgi:peptidoglycan hydrolase-like protein with peptidoglycan-binding domain